MRPTIILLALSLWAKPIVGHHTPRRHSVLAGGGALTGAFVVSVVCDRPVGQRKRGICGRSTAGSAFNGGILGGFTGHVTHLLTADRDYVASPARLLFVRANDGPPCPPEPEPCPPPRKGRWIERNRSVVFAGAEAVVWVRSSGSPSAVIRMLRQSFGLTQSAAPAWASASAAPPSSKSSRAHSPPSAGLHLSVLNELGLLDDAESIGNVHNGPEGPEAAGQL